MPNPLRVARSLPEGHHFAQVTVAEGQLGTMAEGGPRCSNRQNRLAVPQSAQWQGQSGHRHLYSRPGHQGINAGMIDHFQGGIDADLAAVIVGQRQSGNHGINPGTHGPQHQVNGNNIDLLVVLEANGIVSHLCNGSVQGPARRLNPIARLELTCGCTREKVLKMVSVLSIKRTRPRFTQSFGQFAGQFYPAVPPLPQ